MALRATVRGRPERAAYTEPRSTFEGGHVTTDASRGAATLTDRQRERQERILQTVIEQVAAHGLDAVTMESIASTSRVGLGTLYRYFSSREQLLAVATDQWLSGVAREVRARHVTGDRRQRVLDSVTEGAARLHGEPALLRAWLSSHVHAPGTTRGVFEQINGYTLDDGEASLRSDLSLVMDGVWISGVVAWAAGTRDWAEVAGDIRRAVNLVFDAHEAAHRTV